MNINEYIMNRYFAWVKIGIIVQMFIQLYLKNLFYFGKCDMSQYILNVIIQKY